MFWTQFRPQGITEKPGVMRDSLRKAAGDPAPIRHSVLGKSQIELANAQ